MTDFEKYIKGRIAKILHDLDNQITLYDNSLADVQRHKENATNAIFDIMSLSKLEEVYIAGMNEGKEQLVKMANDVFKNLPQPPINANEKCSLHFVSNSEAEEHPYKKAFDKMFDSTLNSEFLGRESEVAVCDGADICRDNSMFPNCGDCVYLIKPESQTDC